MAQTVQVELIYTGLKQIHQQTLTFSLGTTVAEAVHAWALMICCPEISQLPVGIFGQLVEQTRVLRTGDRIELYRPLISDPKEKRRVKALMRLRIPEVEFK